MELSLSESSHWIDEPIVIEESISRFEIGRGYAFGVEFDGETVGAVFVADGTWTIRFERPSDARTAANRLAVLEGVPKEELIAVVAEQHLAETFDRGYLLGDDLWSQISAHLEPVETRNGALVKANKGATEELLVVDTRSLASARRLAEALLEERSSWLGRYSFEPASLLWVNERQLSPLRARFGEFRTRQSWDRYAGETELTAPSRWLAYVRDPSGAFDRESRSQVLAQGTIEDRLVRGIVARERFSEGEDGVVAPPQRLDLEAAGVTALWDREGSGASQRAHIVADLRLRAEGGPAKVVWIEVPHIEQKPYGDLPPLAEGFAFGGVQGPDGRALEARWLPLQGNQRDGAGISRTYAVALPQEIEQGQTIDLRISWADRHRYTHYALFGLSQLPFHTGNTTELVALLPAIRSSSGSPAPLRARVGVRKQHAKQDLVALSGARVAEFDEGAYRFVETLSDTAYASMAVGSWRERYDPATSARPAVRSLLSGPEMALTPKGLVSMARDLPDAIETLLSGWDPALPAYPWTELQLAELYAPRGIEPFLVSGGGLIGIHAFQAPEHFEIYSLTGTLYAQLCMKRAPHSSLSLPVGVLYGLDAVSAHAGPEAAEPFYDRLRVAVPHQRAVRGREALNFIIGRSLSDLVGASALKEAVGRMLAGEFPATIEGLQRATESVTGKDLEGFFEFWLSSALSPKITSEVRRSEHGEAEILLRSDVPFGRFPVPIRVISGDQIRDERVEIIDGEGRLSLPDPPRVDRVEIDPVGSLLLR